MSATPQVLDVRGLQKFYPIHRGLLGRLVGQVRAVDGVSFTIQRGETLSLVGESGCGKTTTARCILRAIAPSEGEIRFRTDSGAEIDVARLGRKELRPLRRQMQMIFQDPFSSLNPRMTIAEIIGEPLLVNGMGNTRTRNARVAELLDLVHLPGAYLNRFPHAFSGGQRQRIGIARALALSPSLIVADEPVSALDVSVQAQIVNLMLELQDRLGIAYLFVAHDLSVVKHVSHRVAVMYVGKIVEVAPTSALFDTPRHPYTEALLSAGECVREPVQVSGRQMHHVQQLGHARVAGSGVGHAVDQQRLADDLRDRHARIERREWILEDHLHLAPQRSQSLAGKSRHIDLGAAFGTKPDFARRRRDGTQDAARGGGLAAAAFAHQGQCLAARDGEADIVDRAHLPGQPSKESAMDRVVFAQRANVENRCQVGSTAITPPPPLAGGGRGEGAAAVLASPPPPNPLPRGEGENFPASPASPASAISLITLWHATSCRSAMATSTGNDFSQTPAMYSWHRG